MRTPLCILILALGLCGTLVYAYIYHQGRPVISLQPVYVEITTIDEAGYPVVGSQIRIENMPKGVTDSFGEWKGIVQAHPGDKLALSIRKRREVGRLHADKVLHIPKELSETTEVKTTVQLTSKKLSKRQTGKKY